MKVITGSFPMFDSIKFNRIQWAMVAVFLGVAYGFCFYLTYLSRFPATDIFLFKDAGANLSLYHTFTVRNLPHMLANQDQLFVYYTPGYPLVYAAWFTVFGFSHPSALLFDLLLQCARTFSMLFFIFRTAPIVTALSITRRSVCLFLVAALSLTMLSADFDRPEELAMVFGFLSWAFLPNRYVLNGLFLGLAAVTAPTAGVFFGLALVIRAVFQKQITVTLKAGLVSLFLFSCFTLPLRILEPNGYERFSKQLNKSVFPYEIPWVNGHSVAQFMISFENAFTFYRTVGWPYLLVAVGFLVCFAGLVYRNKISKSFLPYLASTCIFVPLSIIVWTLQPFYLWYAIVCFSGINLYFILCSNRSKSAFIVFIFLLAPCLSKWAKNSLHGFMRTYDGSSEYIQLELLKEVPVGNRIAITVDAYFLFKDKREIANVNYVCDVLNTFDYVYINTMNTKRYSAKDYDIDCPKYEKCFTVQRDFRLSNPLKILNFELADRVRSYAGVLYKKTRCG